MFQNQNTPKALAVIASHAPTEVLASLHRRLPKPVIDLAEAEKVYELTTPSHTESLEPILSFLATIAQKAGFDETVILEIEIAVEEACVNAIKHAHQNDVAKPIRLRITVDCEKLTVVVRDQGQGFDPKQLEKQDTMALLAKVQPGGRGILMMKMLMDEVHFTFEGGKGTQVRMVRYLYFRVIRDSLKKRHAFKKRKKMRYLENLVMEDERKSILNETSFLHG